MSSLRSQQQGRRQSCRSAACTIFTGDSRLSWLVENKEQLDEKQHQELLALTEFSEQRTLEKVQAQALFRQIAAMDPALVDAEP